MPTDKRQRQKEGQRARRAAALAAARRQQRKRRIRNLVGIAIVVSVSLLLVSQFTGGNDKKAAPTTTTTSTLLPGTHALKASDSPKIEKPTTPAPTGKVEIKDLTVGTGQELKLGDRVEIAYVGANYEGKEFESSWKRKATDIFTIAESSSLIRGWIDGLPGMKVGGRRELVIPTSLAYAGSPPEPALDGPLIFIIELKSILPASG